MSGVLLREVGFEPRDESPWHFRLFGTLQVAHADTPLELGPPKQRALLAVLLLRRGLETGIDQLIEALWGEDYPAYAKNLIQKSVSSLRDLFAAEASCEEGIALEWSAGGYHLDTGNAYVDLYAYEGLASAGISAAREGKILKAAELLERARVMSTGPLAEGLEGPMLQRERLYRQERFLSDMEVRAELELELGRHRNAVPDLHYAVDKYPLRERFVWLLMLALYRSDRGNEALKLYSDHRARGIEEMGAEPGPSLRALHARLLLQDPELMVLPALQPTTLPRLGTILPTLRPDQLT
ncbi:BTAD domain-containing putative transcriptional regulator [Streptomyces sp. NPDC006602]|uniref:AfsR/SARP family transcriptional regulator n=1 Tax=Streptomyces sp. NPDC006602 TaxID=3364751 RepID=UPI00367F4624